SNIDSDRNNNTDFGNIIILKKVKSLRQLRRTEKELVKLCYKEAIIKGFTLKGIQQYIASKTKIWIEWSCLEYLKKIRRTREQRMVFEIGQGSFCIYRNLQSCNRPITATDT